MKSSGTRSAKSLPPAPHPGCGGRLSSALLLLGLLAAALYPIASQRIARSPADAWLFFLPLAIWGIGALFTAWLTRPARFAGDRRFTWLTLLLLGLGIIEQMRFGTWSESWTHWRAYAPLLAGLGAFLFSLCALTPERLARWLPRLRGLCWLGALLPIAALLLFGRTYRGGTFLPGQINPTDITKVLLVAFTAAWLPPHCERLSRTFLGLPIPPLSELLSLAILWGIPLAGAVAVRDLGLLLILSFTLVLMLAVATRRLGWLLLGVLGATLAGWFIRFLSAHTAARFAVWLNPFQDPTGKGWQIGQSLCAQFAGGFWGAGLGEGMPGAVPIVTSDFIYAALAEEWGLIGCALLLLLFWLWLTQGARVAAACREPVCQALGTGLTALAGVQIFLNVAGVTKALPMTGITLPFFSLGGFSLLTSLLSAGLLAALTRSSPHAARS